MPDVVALEWSPSHLCVRSLPGDERVGRAIPSLLPSARHDLVLYAAPRLCVRVPGPMRTPFLVGPTLEPAPPIPGLDSLSSAACRAHQDGSLTAIDGSTLWILPPASEVWVSRRLPDNLRARDASLGVDGCLYLCGSVSGRATVVRLEIDGESSIVADLTADDRRRLAARGADETFWRIDASGEPLVLVSSCAWLFEDDTDFAIVRWGERWQVRVSEDDAIRCWCRRPGGISIYTVAGECHSTLDAGASWTITDLDPSIRRSWDPLRDGALIVRTARESPGRVLVAASTYDWDAPEGKQLLRSAVLLSSDQGRTFTVLATTDGPDHELIDADFT
jgi:hypothetical protein